MTVADFVAGYTLDMAAVLEERLAVKQTSVHDLEAERPAAG
jgi:hypothetical protein